MAHPTLSKLRLIPLVALVMLGCALIGQPGQAQNLFAPVVKVNGRVVTQYELDQRIKLLEFIRTPGDLDKAARESLIEDRLIVEELEDAGLSLTEEELTAEFDKFAKRGNMTGDQLLAQLGSIGIAPESLRDFLSVRALWPQYVGTRFGPRLQVTEAEVDRALALAGQQGSAQVLMSEIILPADPERVDQALLLAAEIKEKARDADVFASAARQFSLSKTRTKGGELDWLAINLLPPSLGPVLLTMSPGDITDPIPIAENVIAVFRMRALREVAATPPATLSVEYAQLLLPGGRSPETLAEAEALRDRIDTCDDLYPIVRDLPDGRFTRETLPVSKLPRGIAVELAKLDPNEVSLNRTIGQGEGEALAFLMLCGRVTELAEGARQEMRQELANQRLQAYAEGFLQELRADAIIETP